MLSVNLIRSETVKSKRSLCFAKFFRDFSSQLCWIFLSEGFLSEGYCMYSEYIFFHISILSVSLCFFVCYHTASREIIDPSLWCLKVSSRDEKNCFSCFCGVSQIIEGIIPMHIRDKFNVCNWKKQQLPCPPHLYVAKISGFLKSRSFYPCYTYLACKISCIILKQQIEIFQFNCYHLITLIKNSLLKPRP